MNDFDRFVDPRDDEVGRLLVEAESIATWTDERRSLIYAVERRMKKGEHLRFQGDYRTYSLFHVGTSLLFRVPENQRGALAPFRGRLIRLVCVANPGRGYCTYMACPYGDSNAPPAPYLQLD